MGRLNDWSIHLYYHWHKSPSIKENCLRLNKFINGLNNRRSDLFFTILIPPNQTIQKYLGSFKNVQWVVSLANPPNEYSLIHNSVVDYINPINKRNTPVMHYKKMDVDLLISFHPLRTYDLWRRYRKTTNNRKVLIANVFEKKIVNEIFKNNLSQYLSDTYDGGFFEGKETMVRIMNDALEYFQPSVVGKRLLNANVYEDLLDNNSLDLFADWISSATTELMKKYPLRKNTEAYKKIKNFIKKKGTTTKYELLSHLNWGVGIDFAQYRYRLKKDKKIEVIGNNTYRWL